MIARKGWKRVGKTALSQLPFLQLATHSIKMHEIYKKQEILVELRKKIQSIKNNPKERKCLEQEAETLQLDINQIKSSLQSFKIYAGLLESTPQAILQMALRIKKDPIHWIFAILQDTQSAFTFSSSILSIITTVSGLITQIPFLVGNDIKTPKHSKVLTFLLVAPLVFVALIPRLVWFSLLFSTFTTDVDTFWPLLYYGIFIVVYFVLHVLGTLKILMRTRDKISVDEETSKILDHHFVLAMIASLMSPYGIFVFGSSYLTLSAWLTSVLQCLAMTTTLLVSTYLYPSWMPEQDFEHVFWYCLVLVPLVILSNLWFWMIQKLVHAKNALYKPILAIKNDDEEYFETLMETKEFNFNLPIPGDKWMRSALLIGNYLIPFLSKNSNVDKTCIVVKSIF